LRSDARRVSFVRTMLGSTAQSKVEGGNSWFPLEHCHAEAFFLAQNIRFNGLEVVEANVHLRTVITLLQVLFVLSSWFPSTRVI
jgi:hypothetical protein